MLHVFLNIRKTKIFSLEPPIKQLRKYHNL